MSNLVIGIDGGGTNTRARLADLDGAVLGAGEAGTSNPVVHGVPAARYWDWGDNDRDVRYNNYLGRDHTRHLDVMDVLACYQPRASAGLLIGSPPWLTTLRGIARGRYFAGPVVR